MKVALVIGHSLKSQGAYNKKSTVTEFQYNEQLAKIIEFITKVDIDIDIVYRNSYKKLPNKINKLKPDYIVSLHCNAFNKRATGTETLFYYKSKNSKELAYKLQEAMLDALNLTDRGIKSKTAEDRGGYLLKYTKAPCVILEPFFIDNNSDYEVGLNQIEELAVCISNVLEKLN